MYLLIGKKNCISCEIMKTKLQNNNIEFEYQLFNELSNEVSFKYLTMARDSGLLEFPLIIKDGKMIDHKEVV
jgi:arsenate reductase-like glutaredoxin family protein